MSFTFLAKSSAYSWKMSFCGHVDCHRIVIGPCAFTTVGKPRAAVPATAAPVRNVRRDDAGVVCESAMVHLRRRCLEVRRESSMLSGSYCNRRARRGVPTLARIQRAGGLAENEAVLGGHPLAGNRARHLDQPDVHRAPAVGTQHRQTRIALHGAACDLTLQLARLGDGPPVERHDDVAALEAAARGRRAVHDVDDHDAEALADAVFRRELVHLLLGQIADPYAQPRPWTCLGDAP